MQFLQNIQALNPRVRAKQRPGDLSVQRRKWSQGQSHTSCTQALDSDPSATQPRAKKELSPRARPPAGPAPAPQAQAGDGLRARGGGRVGPDTVPGEPRATTLEIYGLMCRHTGTHVCADTQVHARADTQVCTRTCADTRAWLWGALGGTPQPSLSQGNTRSCRAGSELPTPGARDPRGLQGATRLGWPCRPGEHVRGPGLSPRQTALHTGQDKPT